MSAFSKIAEFTAAGSETSGFASGNLPLDLKGLRYLLTHEIDTFLGTPTTAPLTGLDYIYNQLREILIMAACGACLAFLYEIYDVGMVKVLRRGRSILQSRSDRRLRFIGNDDENYDELIRELSVPRAERIIGRLINTSALIRITDIIFCLVAGFIILQFWYGSSFCSASVHEGLALIAGTVLGRKVFNLRNSKHLHTIALVYVIMLLIAYIIIA